MLLPHSLWFSATCSSIKNSLHLGPCLTGLILLQTTFISGVECYVHAGLAHEKAIHRETPCTRRKQYKRAGTVCSWRLFAVKPPLEEMAIYIPHTSHLLLSPSLVTRLVAAVLSDPSVPERPDKSVRLPEFQLTSQASQASRASLMTTRGCGVLACHPLQPRWTNKPSTRFPDLNLDVGWWFRYAGPLACSRPCGIVHS